MALKMLRASSCFSSAPMHLLTKKLLVAVLGLGLLPKAFAIGQQTCVSFKSSPSSFAVVTGRKAAPIFLSKDEWPGVQRTAFDFASDIEKVTGISPKLSNVTSDVKTSSASLPVIVGTLGKSSLIDAVVNHAKLDVSSLNGTWESFMIKEVSSPLPGVPKALAIIGSDKRGTIFALYDLSEQIGVSPWYW